MINIEVVEHGQTLRLHAAISNGTLPPTTEIEARLGRHVLTEGAMVDRDLVIPAIVVVFGDTRLPSVSFIETEIIASSQNPFHKIRGFKTTPRHRSSLPNHILLREFHLGGTFARGITVASRNFRAEALDALGYGPLTQVDPSYVPQEENFAAFIALCMKELNGAVGTAVVFEPSSYYHPELQSSL